MRACIRPGRFAAMALASLLAACSNGPVAPDLGEIYAPVADADLVTRRPLITVPGTLGSRLRDSRSGTLVWGGGSRGLSADPEDPEEAQLIALPILGPDEPLEALRDTVEPAGILETASARILGIPVDVNVYGGILETLSAGGFQNRSRAPQFGRAGRESELAGGTMRAGAPDEAAAEASGTGPTLQDYGRVVEDAANAFRFDYDWRRDIPLLAAEFDVFVRERKRHVAAIRTLRTGRRVDPEAVRFDMLAHSMGGLLARWYLMYGTAELGEEGPLPEITWAGAEHFSRVIVVAAPNAGSIVAVDNLVNGKSLGPFQPVFPAPLLATHASTWQLFPRARHARVRRLEGGRPAEALDPLDPELWARNRWGLMDAEADALLAWLMPEVEDPAERRARAAAHQARLMRRARRFHEAMDRWAPKPDHLEMFLVVGGGFRTPALGAVDSGARAFRLVGEEEGDGVVLRASVLLDERQGEGADRPAGALRTPLRFDTTLFLPDEHVELTRNPVFGDNLLFWLLEQPRDPGDLAEPRGTGAQARQTTILPATRRDR